MCHKGCSTARLARDGWPVSGQCLLIRGREGKQRVEVTTIAVDEGDRPLFLHVLIPRHETGSARPPSRLTPRQEEVLGLLAEGVAAKVIGTRLGLSEATVRNHIRAILAALGSHSQLEAIAKARRLQLLG
jgi:DNA-binding NarL/FixJ family response regulator